MLKLENHLENVFKLAIANLGFENEDIFFEPAKDIKYGDLFTSVACRIASKYKKNPKKIAEDIVKGIGELDYVEGIKAEANGFINMTLSSKAYQEYYRKVDLVKEGIGRIHPGKEWFFLEIVSANPTGLLHIGHVRHGVFTDTLSNILEYRGKRVYKEYLINDLGNQIRELIDSVWTKYRHKFFDSRIEDLGRELSYSGIEIDECVGYLMEKYGSDLFLTEDIIESNLYGRIKETVLEYFLKKIKDSMDEYEIRVNIWKRESSFINDDTINNLLRSIKNYLEMRDGAVWFKASEVLEGQKDEVLIKSNGQHTYFCQDLIYHQYKLNLLGNNGSVVNVLGADHYGHIDKLKAFFKAIDVKDDKVKFVCLQLVKLIRNGQALKMSKRDSTVIHMRDLKDYMNYEEVRWFFVSQQSNSPLEIDIGKLKLKDYNNPVFYVMYAYSRIMKILIKRGSYVVNIKDLKFEGMTDKEREIMNYLMLYEDTLDSCVESFSPHKLPQYLHKLSQLFHSLYEESTVIGDKRENEKIAILNAVRYTIQSGLDLMRIKAKENL